MFPRFSLLRPILPGLLFVTSLLFDATDALAQLVVHEPQWTLLKTFDFQQPMAVNCNPIDGRTYLGRRGSTSDGLYRIDLGGFAVKLSASSNIAGVVVDPPPFSAPAPA